MNKALKYLLFMLVMGVLWLPTTNKMFGLFPAWTLNGSYETLQEPVFIWDDWFNGEFQKKFEPWFNEQIGGREYLIRFRNQYYFSVFNMAMANGVTPAKDGVLLDVGYVDAFYGKDFAGEEFLTDRLRKWQRIERGLDSIGVKAFMTLAPGKGSFFEEQFTDFLKDKHRPTTNYKFIKSWGDENGLRVLDLKSVYHSWNDTSRYPLFPKGGIHWSEYGAAHICDTLRGYIQTVTGRPLQEFWFDIELSDTARGADSDIADGMNLLFTPKEEKLAYPIRYFGEDSDIDPTNFLVIADSYYYMLMHSGFGNRVANYGGFWFYFEDAQPHGQFPSNNVEELDILAEIKKQDVLMLMMTEPQMQRLGWDAIDELERVLYPRD
ncbi:hypothetical protein OAE48_03045 [Flavobacteriales bacterium]|nr:hypothetical protein [Flavobacteriales bacterium]